ncbi:ferredoxin reductase family protein [Seohaeicola zhoushanensis]|uniref:Oxidoreductase n=1 Tax=Seohaeicola zhoushanensis TaxID=1569283 RepID=A0A8J3M444_9RHOB|nr:ferredoxin reductase family protein [Seohaeicola zhoushanensis]GHF37187.1 oxidoreductase [Seohaeicola zhoushanensis]
MNPRLLLAIYLAITLAPLGLSAFSGRPARSLWDELASGAGMLAYAIILAEFLLSGRFRSISRRIGMDVTMRFHQLFARSALVFALLHPFLYRAPSKPPYPWDTTRQLTLTDDLSAIASGVAAWLLLTPLVLQAIGRDRLDMRYEVWRLMHGLGAAAVAALLLHHTLAAGRYSADPVLAAVWIGLFAIALASLLSIYLVKPVLKRMRPWVVDSVRPVAARTWEVTLAPRGHGGLRYLAGQFAWLNIGHGPASLFENPFSISSAPAAGNRVAFIIKELGDFTRTVGRIRPGTPAYLDAPHGHLCVAGRDEPGIALIAGGVGIAPLLGILRQLRLDRDPRPTLLAYGNRVAEQIVCRDEIDDLARHHGTRVIHALQEPPPGWTGHSGMLDAAFFRDHLADPGMREWLFVICGPPAMMDAAETALIGLGVPARQIICERFRYD